MKGNDTMFGTFFRWPTGIAIMEPAEKELERDGRHQSLATQVKDSVAELEPTAETNGVGLCWCVRSCGCRGELIVTN